MNLNDDNDVLQLKTRLFDLADEPRRMLPPIEGFEEQPLVSLEEAVEPLVKEMPDIGERARIAKQGCKKPPDHGLSIDGSASIRLYTMQSANNQSLYTILNKTLRDANRNHLKKWFLYLKLIITSLRKIPSKPCDLFRGVKLDLSQEHPKGQETIWWAFSSCTDSLEVLEKPTFLGKSGTRTLFQIKSYSAKDIRQHSKFTPENELIFLPATMFKIIRNFDAGQGLHIIHLEEIEPEMILIEGGPVLPDSSTSADGLNVKIDSIDDRNYRNRELEDCIAGVRPGSNMNLGGLRLNNRDMKIVVDQAIVGKQCKTLSLAENGITLQGILTLANGIYKSTTLEEVDLSNNHLSDDELVPLTQELMNSRSITVELWRICTMRIEKELDAGPIKILNLSNNNIGDEGARHLAGVLKAKRTLIHLNLSHNQIGNMGVRLLASALSHRDANLKQLDLQNNRSISDASVDCLMDMIKESRSMNTLWLSNCDFSDNGRRKLSDAADKKKKFQLLIEL